MKKIKKSLIFTFITILGFLSFVLPLSVSAQTVENELNNVPNNQTSNLLKMYLYEHFSYQEGYIFYFDFTSIPNTYDYFIFNFSNNFTKTLFFGEIYENSIDITDGSGIRFTDERELHWKINFNGNISSSDYVIVVNYNNILDAPNLINTAYNDGYDAGFDNGYDAGYDAGLDVSYETGYDAGYDAGLDVSYNDGYDAGVLDGYNYGYENGYGFGFAEGVDAGYFEGYEVGRNDYGQYFPPGSPDGFDGWYGYQDGYNYGYNKGLDAGGDINNTFYGIISQVFTGLGSFLGIELLPNITFGAIFAVPLVFGIIFFIIGKRGGKND